MVLDSVLKKVESEELVIHVVWMPVLRNDSFEATADAVQLIPDPRAIHYWDGDQDLGMAYGRVVDLPRGRELAWDIYFVYEPGVVWGEQVPEPSAWAHQLGSDGRHLGDGAGLRSAVEEILIAMEPESSKAVRGLIGGR